MNLRSYLRNRSFEIFQRVSEYLNNFRKRRMLQIALLPGIKVFNIVRLNEGKKLESLDKIDIKQDT